MLETKSFLISFLLFTRLRSYRERMADTTTPTSAPTGQQNGPTTNKSKLPQIEPFTAAESIVQSLQVQDALLLQASLVQIDKRAAALNAKPAPRGSPDLLLDYLKKYPGCEGIFHAWDYANKVSLSCHPNPNRDR